MKREEALMLVARVAAIWPQRELSKATVEEYVTGITDLSVPTVAAAIEELKTTVKWLPSIAEIRELAIEAKPGPKRPSAEEAWAEVRKQVNQVGSSRGMMDADGNQRQPVWTYPLVGRVADLVGWTDICFTEHPDAIRREYIKAYGNAAERERREAVLTPLGREMRSALSVQPAREELPAIKVT